MPFNSIAFGLCVKHYRKKRGYSQSYLSELIEKTPPYLSLVENGERGISVETLIDLANALEVTADELLKDSLNYSTELMNSRFAALLADCKDSEITILLDIVAATKDSLRKKGLH